MSVAEPTRPSAPQAPVAALDCGTNSTRLLVAGPDRSTLQRDMVITRLGQGVDGQRRLADEAVARTLAVLREFRRAMDHHGVVRARAVATSAVRDAANGHDFLDGAADVLGTRPELLSGEEEGRLSYLGATAELDPGDGPFLVVDIGGGSTELVVAGAAVSIDVGCVRLTERFLSSDPPTAAELDAGRRAVRALLASAGPTLLAAGPAPRRMVGLAGTVSTAAVLDAGEGSYAREVVHHRVLTRAGMESLLERLAGMDHARRLSVPGLEPARADVIVGGLTVLVTVMDHFGFEEVLASESDILDGIVSSLLPL